MSRPEKPEKYHSNLEDELKAKVRTDYVGHDDIDAKYLGKCSNHYYEYDECLRDLVGDNISCEVFRKGIQRCEEESGMYEDVLNNLGIVPEKELTLSTPISIPSNQPNPPKLHPTKIFSLLNILVFVSFFSCLNCIDTFINNTMFILIKNHLIH